jgi:hypothetical protein
MIGFSQMYKGLRKQELHARVNSLWFGQRYRSINRSIFDGAPKRRSIDVGPMQDSEELVVGLMTFSSATYIAAVRPLLAAIAGSGLSRVNIKWATDEARRKLGPRISPSPSAALRSDVHDHPSHELDVFHSV